MPSPGAVADAIAYSINGHARVTAQLTQKRLAATEQELQKANAMYFDSAARSWLWSSRAKAYEEVLFELQSRYPNDALFQRVGGVHANGKPKMVLHQKIEVAFNKHFKSDGIIRTRALAQLNQFLKWRPY